MAKSKNTETEAAAPAIPSGKEITIQGVSVIVKAPYSEGHTCSAAEAASLNQTRAENVRNNTAKLVKELRDKLGLDKEADIPEEQLGEVLEKIAAYDNDYEFTLASVGGGRRSVDPLEAECMKIARQSVHNTISENGLKVKDFDKDDLAGAYALVAAKPETVEQARDALAQRAKRAKLGLEELGITATKAA